ncbi:MAG: hypothetical protein AB7K09_22735 [Planctomycetota bacterium]
MNLWFNWFQRAMRQLARDRGDSADTTLWMILRRTGATLGILLLVVALPIALVWQALTWVGTFRRAGSGGRTPVYRVRAVNPEEQDSAFRDVEFGIWYGNEQHGIQHVIHVPAREAENMPVGSTWAISNADHRRSAEAPTWGRDVELRRIEESATGNR